MRPQPTIAVVSGLLIRSGEILMGLRPQGKKRPGLWELPGGKIEDGEGVGEALEREWKEELGVDISSGHLLGKVEMDVEWHLRLYLLTVHETHRIVPSALHHSELRWVDPIYALEYLPCSPGYYLHYNLIRREMNLAR